MLLAAVILIIISGGTLLVSRRKSGKIIPALFMCISFLILISVLYITKVGDYKFLLQMDYSLYLVIKKLHLTIITISRIFNLAVVAYMVCIAVFLRKTGLIGNIALGIMVCSEIVFLILSDHAVSYELYMHTYFSPVQDFLTVLYDVRPKIIDGIFIIHMILPIFLTAVKVIRSKIFLVQRTLLRQGAIVGAGNLCVYLVYFYMYFKAIWITNTDISKIPNVVNENITGTLVLVFVLLIVAAVQMISSLKDIRYVLSKSERNDEMFNKNFGNQLHMYKNALIAIGQQFHLIEMMRQNKADGIDVVVANGIDMTDKTIKQMESVLLLLRRRTTKRMPVDLIPVIENACRKIIVPGTATIKKDFCKEEIFVCGDEDRLNEVFVNLFKNSVEASGDKEIEISIRIIEEHGYYMIIFRDNGEGIEQKDIQYIFSSFFTTKSRVGGIGLSFVQDVVSEHGGKIKAKSKKGEYTEFNIVLPKYNY